MDREDRGDRGKGKPGRTSAADGAKRARDAKLALALRANLRRRKADLAGRGADPVPDLGDEKDRD